MEAEDAAGIPLYNGLCETIFFDSCVTLHHVTIIGLAHQDLVGFSRLGLREAYGGNLRITVNRVGNRSKIHFCLFLVGGIVPGDFDLLICCMGEHLLTRCITYRPYVLLGGLEVVVDFYEAGPVRLHTRLWEIETAGV